MSRAPLPTSPGPVLHRRGFEVVLPLEPPGATHHAKSIVRYGRRWGLKDNPDLVAAKARYDILLKASGKRPRIPLDGPIALEIVFTFETPDAGRWGKPHTVKPDFDNLSKTAVDALVAAKFINLDQRICSGKITKRWGSKGEVLLRAMELEERAELF